MPEERLWQARLVALFLLGAALFTAPLLRIASTPTRVLGLPLPWVYLFVSWAGFILVTALLVRPARRRE